MSELGAGPVLDENFDFVIDRDGDITTEIGLPELEKDLAVIVAETVDEMALGRSTGGELEDVRIALGTAIAADDRIDSIRRLTIESDTGQRYKIEITIETTTADGPFDLVIPFTN